MKGREGSVPGGAQPGERRAREDGGRLRGCGAATVRGTGPGLEGCGHLEVPLVRAWGGSGGRVPGSLREQGRE